MPLRILAESLEYQQRLLATLEASTNKIKLMLGSECQIYNQSNFLGWIMAFRPSIIIITVKEWLVDSEDSKWVLYELNLRMEQVIVETTSRKKVCNRDSQQQNMRVNQAKAAQSIKNNKNRQRRYEIGVLQLRWKLGTKLGFGPSSELFKQLIAQQQQITHAIIEVGDFLQLKCDLAYSLAELPELLETTSPKIINNRYLLKSIEREEHC